jgi:hypothetical protein
MPESDAAADFVTRFAVDEADDEEAGAEFCASASVESDNAAMARAAKGKSIRRDSISQSYRMRPRFAGTNAVKKNLYAALPRTGCVQCAQRLASIGISLRHSGHFLVVGSAGGGSFFIRAINQLTGTTTKK